MAVFRAHIISSLFIFYESVRNIQRFRESKHCWLVSVSMIVEIA